MWYCSKPCQREAWKSHKPSCGCGPPAPGGGARVPPREGQVLQISNFPDHHVRRLPNGEWAIQNENVVLVSCHTPQDLTSIFAGDISSESQTVQDREAYFLRLAALVQECRSLKLLLSGESQIEVERHIRARKSQGSASAVKCASEQQS